MTAAQEARKQLIRAERVSKKYERIQVLSTLLDMHEALPQGRMDIEYIRGLKYRLMKCRNELRNMGADRNGN